ncbi:aspartic protease [Aphelenchoides avenae]|nr:aspartic protease [Aphelenchus avenae]
MVAILPLLIACCLATTAYAGGFQVSVKRIERRWAAYQSLKSGVHFAQLASSSQPLIDFEDGEYIANVSIGTPPQHLLLLLLLLDTSGAAIWVPDKTCPSRKCPSWCADAGIGPADNWIPGIVPPLVNAKKQGVIEKNVVSIALIREGTESPDLPGGTVTYGAADTKNCDAVMSYIPATEVGLGDPSVLPLQGINFGNLQARPEVNVAWTAYIGLGATAVKGPIEVIKALAQEVGAKVDGLGRYPITCNASVPSLYLTFGGQRYEIPPSELVRPLSEASSQCVLNIYGDTGYSPSLFSIGAALARKYCLIFDFDNLRFGFAPNRYSN